VVFPGPPLSVGQFSDAPPPVPEDNCLGLVKYGKDVLTTTKGEKEHRTLTFLHLPPDSWQKEYQTPYFSSPYYCQCPSTKNANDYHFSCCIGMLIADVLKQKQVRESKSATVWTGI